MFSFSPFKEKAVEIENWLQKELSAVRSGRALPVFFDSVQVEAYGGRMNIKELATILVEDPRTIRIEAWDKSQAKNIEKSLIASNLGLGINVDDRGIRVVFPELTSERREQLKKLVKQKLEEARVSLRSIRDKTVGEIEQKEKAGGMGQDDKFRLKEELQDFVNESNKKLEDLFERKVTELDG